MRNSCGARIDNKSNAIVSEDSSGFGFAIFGFFIPIVGLILFLIYEGKKSKRAKSAGKGALIGFITKIVLSIILVILYVVFAASLFSNISDDIESNIPAIGDVFREETKDFVRVAELDAPFLSFQKRRAHPAMNLAISETAPQQTITRIGLLCLTRSTTSAAANSAT